MPLLRGFSCQPATGYPRRRKPRPPGTSKWRVRRSTGSQWFQRNAGNVIAVQELLEAEKQHRNCKEVSCNRRKDVLAALAPLLAEAGCQRQSAAAEGYFPQHERQPKPISRIVCPSSVSYTHLTLPTKR